MAWFRFSYRVTPAELIELENDRRAHERPNEPPAQTRCDGDKALYGVHNFTVVDTAGRRICQFCGRGFEECFAPERDRP